VLWPDSPATSIPTGAIPRNDQDECKAMKGIG